MLYKTLKFVFDRLFAFFLLLLFLPFMALIVVALYAAGEKQIFYKQQRVGYQNRIFWIYKFCTMYDVYDATGELLPEEQRYSRLGRFLRKNSLNELPQLWNILRGDMSFVGPRPLLPEY